MVNRLSAHIGFSSSRSRTNAHGPTISSRISCHICAYFLIVLHQTDCTIAKAVVRSLAEQAFSGESSPEKKLDCPLCQEAILPGIHLERHIGRHLEELALFAMPKSHTEEGAESNASRWSPAKASTLDDDISDELDNKESEAPEAENETTQVGPSEPAPRIRTTIRGRQLDITGLGVNLEFLELLPEEIREEFILQTLVDRRS